MSRNDPVHARNVGATEHAPDSTPEVVEIVKGETDDEWRNTDFHAGHRCVIRSRFCEDAVKSKSSQIPKSLIEGLFNVFAYLREVHQPPLQRALNRRLYDVDEVRGSFVVPIVRTAGARADGW